MVVSLLALSLWNTMDDFNEKNGIKYESEIFKNSLHFFLA